MALTSRKNLSRVLSMTFLNNYSFDRRSPLLLLSIYAFTFKTRAETHVGPRVTWLLQLPELHRI